MTRSQIATLKTFVDGGGRFAILYDDGSWYIIREVEVGDPTNLIVSGGSDHHGSRHWINAEAVRPDQIVNLNYGVYLGE